MKINKITTIFEIILGAESMQWHPELLALEASLHPSLLQQIALFTALPYCLPLLVQLRRGDPMVESVEPHLLR